MALGIKPNTSGEKGEDNSLSRLKAEFDETYRRIKGLLVGVGDIDQLDRDKKAKLRSEYSNLARLAQTISKRTTSTDEREKYDKLCQMARKEAVSYGSIMTQSSKRIRLEDVKGLKEVKAMVGTFLYMIQNPDIIKAYKMDGGLGLMMYGAPGTGKTMIAEAIATELDLPLFVMTPADIFKSYVGESEQAVKQIFREIELCEDGAILFVDECESIFSKRGMDDKDYKSAVTTELLQRINGFGVDGSKRILIGATNRPDKIDPAYLRHKRFSHLVHITPPDEDAMREIISSKLEGIPCEVSTEDLLYMFMMNSEGGRYSGADVCGVIEEACRLAIERLVEARSTKIIPITREMFEKALSKKAPSISAAALKSYENFGAKVEELR